ncbi:unnamed protein product, partial [Sphacelaria rigidula]
DVDSLFAVDDSAPAAAVSRRSGATGAVAHDPSLVEPKLRGCAISPGERSMTVSRTPVAHWMGSPLAEQASAECSLMEAAAEKSCGGSSTFGAAPTVAFSAGGRSCFCSAGSTVHPTAKRESTSAAAEHAFVTDVAGNDSVREMAASATAGTAIAPVVTKSALVVQ